MEQEQAVILLYIFKIKSDKFEVGEFYMDFSGNSTISKTNYYVSSFPFALVILTSVQLICLNSFKNVGTETQKNCQVCPGISLQ